MLQRICECSWRARAGAEENLERASEKSPVWCGHKDVLRLNKGWFLSRKKETEAAVVCGVTNRSPAPALNIFNALNWKN